MKSKKTANNSEKIQDLCKQIESMGFVIRKEKLKQGFGWKCNSGSCFFKGRPVLFLDSKLSPEEQADFLSSFLAGLNGSQGAEQVAA